MTTRKLLVALATVWMPVVLLATAAHTQPVAQGGEFLVDDAQAGRSNTFPAVAADGTGKFVVVWMSFPPPPAEGTEIRGRRFDGAGSPNGTEFLVATSEGGRYQPVPRVAMDPDGSFLVVWLESEPKVVARAYDGDGLPHGEPFRVDTTIFTYEHGDYRGYEDRKGYPDVAAVGAGRYEVVWEGGYNDYLYHVHQRRYILNQQLEANGTFVGGEGPVGGDLYYFSQRPAVAAGGSGSFVVVWNQILAYDYYYSGNYQYRSGVYGIRARKLPIGSTQDVGPAGDEGPRVAADAAGRFIVVWPHAWEVRAQRYDEAAEPVGTAFRVNSQNSIMGYGDRLDVEISGAGSAVAAWSGERSGGDGDRDVFARTYAADGSELGTEVVLNAHTTGAQSSPAIAFTDADRFVVAWSVADSRIIARRFDRAPGCGDASADGLITSTDALFALGAAVGARACAACVCDPNLTGGVTVSDALTILRAAVGQVVALDCTDC